MALTDAKKASDKRHIAKLDVIKIQPYKEEGAVIRSAAAASKKSLQAYILEAVREKMEREKNSIGASYGISSEVQNGNIDSGFITQLGPDFQTALSASGQSEGDYIAQAVAERIEREKRPL